MKNKDIEQLSREQLAQKFNEALKTEDTEQVAQAMAEMAAGIEEEILQQLSSWTHRQWQHADFAS